MHVRSKSQLYKGQDSVSKRHPPPLIDEFAEDLAVSLAYEFPSDQMPAKLRAFARHREDISPEVRQLLVKELQALAARATERANHLARGNGLIVAESHATVDAVERDNAHQTFNTGNHCAHPLRSCAEAMSRNSARSSS